MAAGKVQEAAKPHRQKTRWHSAAHAAAMIWPMHYIIAPPPTHPHTHTPRWLNHHKSLVYVNTLNAVHTSGRLDGLVVQPPVHIQFAAHAFSGDALYSAPVNSICTYTQLLESPSTLTAAVSERKRFIRDTDLSPSSSQHGVSQMLLPTGETFTTSSLMKANSSMHCKSVSKSQRIFHKT